MTPGLTVCSNYNLALVGSDPCLEVGAGFCDPRAHCVAVGSQPRCRCNDGYEGDGTRCTGEYTICKIQR